NERAGQAGLEIMHKAFFLRNESKRCRSFLQRSSAALGKLLFETGYFPAKPRITYVFLYRRWRIMGLGGKAGNGFPPVRQQELWMGSC
ncbi:MAG: hypothetical protein J6T09_03810, partial [Bacteroidales bacterium]|nr:hypothetical protein [Bacteroidales bacterium]